MSSFYDDFHDPKFTFIGRDDDFVIVSPRPYIAKRTGKKVGKKEKEDFRKLLEERARQEGFAVTRFDDEEIRVRMKKVDEGDDSSESSSLNNDYIVAGTDNDLERQTRDSDPGNQPVSERAFENGIIRVLNDTSARLNPDPRAHYLSEEDKESDVPSKEEFLSRIAALKRQLDMLQKAEKETKLQIQILESIQTVSELQKNRKREFDMI